MIATEERVDSSGEALERMYPPLRAVGIEDAVGVEVPAGAVTVDVDDEKAS